MKIFDFRGSFKMFHFETAFYFSKVLALQIKRDILPALLTGAGLH
jgi:hypothetical protein